MKFKIMNPLDYLFYKISRLGAPIGITINGARNISSILLSANICVLYIQFTGKFPPVGFCIIPWIIFGLYFYIRNDDKILTRYNVEVGWQSIIGTMIVVVYIILTLYSSIYVFNVL